MKKLLSIICAGVMLFSFSALAGCGGSDTIVIGSKDFTEQDILGNMIYLYLKKNTDLKYEYKNEMSSNVLFEAIKKGSVDIYTDYTGTVYANYLQHTDVKTADEVYEISKREIKEQFKIDMLDTLGFNNTYTLSVRKDTASEYNLKTYSDLAAVSGELIFGGTFEILNRPDGIPGLKTKYNMNFKEEKGLDSTLRYQALNEKKVDVIDAFSTDGLLKKYDLVVLTDDKQFFPPYYAVPLVRDDLITNHPEIETLLLKLKNILDDDTMRELNYKVDVEQQEASVIAEDFLTEKGLI